MFYTLITSCILFLMINYTSGASSCYAPPVIYGMVCQGDGVIGSPGTRVGYKIKQVNNVGTLLCCKARGYQGNTEVWMELPCSPDDVTGSVPWGSNAATKAIQCKGMPTGTSVEWS